MNEGLIVMGAGLLLGALIIFIPDSTGLKVDCTNAPSQYKEAGTFIDAGHKITCDPKGLKNYVFYSDGWIAK